MLVVDRVTERPGRENRYGVQIALHARQRKVVRIVLSGRAFREKGTKSSQRARETRAGDKRCITPTMVYQIAVVAGEELVSPIPRENDFDMLASKPRDEKGGNGRGVGEGLIE